MKKEKFRDLILISINDKQSLVIACDSNGGIGNKKKDIIKVTPSILGYFTTQVALCEVLAIGAKPITVINTLSVEMDDTGKQIIDGIEKALEPLGISKEVIVTGSTEENIPVCQTGMGVTVIGIVDKASWIIPKTEPETLVVVIGIPKVGKEVLKSKKEDMFSLTLLLELLNKPYIQEILPVGSKGIIHEVNQIAKTNSLIFKADEDIALDINKSAGPSTCAVVSIAKKNYEKLSRVCSIPVTRIGRFIKE